MKAKVIKTGEIIDVYHEPQHGQITNIYKESVLVNGRMWTEDELDFCVKANELYPITSEFLEKSGFKRREYAKHNDVEYYHIFHSEVYGDIALIINLTHKDYSMEASRLSTSDGHGYSSWWLPNPMYVYQLEKIFDLLEIKIKL